MSIKNIIINLKNDYDEEEYNPSESSSQFSSDEEYEDDSEVEQDLTDEDKCIISDFDKNISKLHSIDCLVRIIEQYDTTNKRLFKNHSQYKDFLTKLIRIRNPLKSLYNLIGLKKAKHTIFTQLMYFIQNLHDGKLDMLHTIIEGPPGVGKTELGLILCELYAKLGILSNNKYTIARRSDLIGEYLGQTAIKTQKIIDKANGGVLFIDEAYSLGDNSKRDSYSKECVDTLNMNLTENKHSMMCIIAGYKDALEESFFNMNEGLKRRFNFRISIDGYSPEELHSLLLFKMKEIEWKIASPVSKHCPFSLFKQNYKFFNHFGGDIENFILCIKLSHSCDLMKKRKQRKCVDKYDIEHALEMFKKNKDIKEIDDTSHLHMYI